MSRTRSPCSFAAVSCSALLGWLLLACDDYAVPKDRSGTFAACCDGLGLCVASGLVAPAQGQRLSRDSCGESLLCAPRELLVPGRGYPAPCTVSATDAEGRCLPACLPELARHASRLSRDRCPSEQLCAPCFDPVSGEATGACTLGADPGPRAPKRSLDTCCGELGRCVPDAWLASDERAHLSQLDCSSGAALCVPELLARDERAQPQRCEAAGTHAEGRCLPACLPEVAQRKQHLERDVCQEGELCAPCFDPLSGEATSACSLGGDPGPSESPMPFSDCCGDEGRCVPQALLSSQERAQLGRDSCGSDSELCAPEPLARDPGHVFSSCEQSATGAEGRCLPACLPPVAARAAQLAQDGCGDAELCTPCYDPRDGKSTGACALGGDTGPARPPSVLPDCCDALGRCVPSSWVDTSDVPRLGRDNCSSQSALCVPVGLARDAQYAFASCLTSAFKGEGRCLPACLPELAARAAQLFEDGCGTGNRCAPCYDPVDGAATGACALGGDPGPARAPVLFATCCEKVGRCVPPELVPEEDQSQLARDSCADTNYLCAPASLAKDSRYVFASCSDGNTGGEGRCLPSCLPQVAAHAEQLTRGACVSTELCAPCYDPLTGAMTSACALAGDPGPARAPTTYPQCCSDAGRCIVSSQVPAQARDKLNADGCDAPSGQLCVPLSLARAPKAPPATCHDSATAAEGRCLMQCLPQVAPQASRLRQSGCGSAELCVPCYDPVRGDSTGACSFSAADPGPSEPKQVFEACCGGGGLCVPQQLLPGGSSSLSAQSCTRTGYVCAPRALVAEPNGRLPSCISVLGPSVCVASCFVPAGLGDVLAASSCSPDEKCVPCWAASGLCP